MTEPHKLVTSAQVNSLIDQISERPDSYFVAARDFIDVFVEEMLTTSQDRDGHEILVLDPDVLTELRRRLSPDE